MALRGNLKDFSLPDVFQLVTLSRKTGILRIKRADGAEGSVWFREGDVFFAQSNWQREPLGERLVSANKITPSALSRALEAQRAEGTGGRRLGQILVDDGYVTDKVLEAFVQEQIQDTIFDLFRWDEGDFDFEPLEETPAEDIGLSVSIENIVMEGSRRLEEWNRIKKKIPSMEIVFKMATAPGEGTFEISLKPVEWSLLLLVDGTRALADLARDTNRTDFEVARVLYGLFSAGLLEVAPDDEVERLRGERERLEARAGELRRAAAQEARESAPTAVAAPEPSAAPPAPRVPEHVPEVPTFLSGQAQEGLSAEDMAVFEQMMGAVLQAPREGEAPIETPAEEAVAEAVPESLAREAAPAPPAFFEEAPAAAIPEPPVVEGEMPAAEAAAAPPVEAETAAAAAAEAVEVPEVAAGEEPLSVEPVASLGAEGLDASDFFMEGPVVTEPMSIAEVAAAPSAEPTIAEIEAAALAEAAAAEQAPPEAPAGIEGVEVHGTGMELGETAPVEIVAEPAEEEEIEALEPLSDEAADNLSDLLSVLREEGEETAVAEQSAEPAEASLAPEQAAGGPVGTEGVAETEGVISTDAFLSDFEDVGAGTFSGGLADELTALTGGGRARPTAAPAAPPPSEHAAIRRDQMVDKDLVMKVIEGIKSL